MKAENGKMQSAKGTETGTMEQWINGVLGEHALLQYSSTSIRNASPVSLEETLFLGIAGELGAGI